MAKQCLEAPDGAREAFGILVDAGIPVIALLNGAKSSTDGLLERANLSDLVREVMSVDDVKLAKPRAEISLHAARKTGIEPIDLALVAAHPWDVNGAAAAGLLTAYLAADRPYSHACENPTCRRIHRRNSRNGWQSCRRRPFTRVAHIRPATGSGLASVGPSSRESGANHPCFTSVRSRAGLERARILSNCRKR